jgi:hypothetical protein
MKKVQVKDAYGNDYDGTVVKVGRKYVYVQIEWTGFRPETIPFERANGRTSQGYEESHNALPMFLQK